MTAAQPTQVKHPWRSTLRTLVVAAIGFLPVLPEALSSVHLDTTVVGGQAIIVVGAVQRLLVLPAVEAWLKRFVPFLAATPKS